MQRGITEEKIQNYEAALSMQMFLIQEIGPTKLLFKVGDGQDSQKVKISVAEKI